VSVTGACLLHYSTLKHLIKVVESNNDKHATLLHSQTSEMVEDSKDKHANLLHRLLISTERS
jgi:hypothetical protein